MLNVNTNFYLKKKLFFVIPNGDYYGWAVSKTWGTKAIEMSRSR